MIILQILKDDIHLPELLNIKVSNFLDYPPKFLIYIKSTTITSGPPKLQVLGLDRECYFELPTPSKTCMHLTMLIRLQTVSKSLAKCQPSMNDQSGASTSLTSEPMNVRISACNYYFPVAIYTDTHAGRSSSRFPSLCVTAPS